MFNENIGISQIKESKTGCKQCLMFTSTQLHPFRKALNPFLKFLVFYQFKWDINSVYWNPCLGK